MPHRISIVGSQITDIEVDQLLAGASSTCWLRWGGALKHKEAPHITTKHLPAHMSSCYRLLFLVLHGPHPCRASCQHSMQRSWACTPSTQMTLSMTWLLKRCWARQTWMQPRKTNYLHIHDQAGRCLLTLWVCTNMHLAKQYNAFWCVLIYFVSYTTIPLCPTISLMSSLSFFAWNSDCQVCCFRTYHAHDNQVHIDSIGIDSSSVSRKGRTGGKQLPERYWQEHLSLCSGLVVGLKWTAFWLNWPDCAWDCCTVFERWAFNWMYDLSCNLCCQSQCTRCYFVLQTQPQHVC